MQSYSTFDENLQKKLLTSWADYQSHLRLLVINYVNTLHHLQPFLKLDEEKMEDFSSSIHTLNVIFNSISKIMGIKPANKGELLMDIMIIENCLKRLSPILEPLTDNNTDLNIKPLKAQINELEKFLKKLNVYVFDYGMYNIVQSEIQSMSEIQVKPTKSRTCCTPFHTSSSKKDTLQQSDCTIL